MKLNEKLRMLRKNKKISMNKLSKEVNVSKSSLWELERGIRKPSAETLDKLAKFFGTSLDYLMDKDDNSSIDTATEIFNRVKNLSLEEQEKVNMLIKILF